MTATSPSTLVDWLDDLCVRFLLNLPASELSSVPRLCFQVEEAQWFYEDFVRPAVAASGAVPLPHLPLRQFCLLLFQHCPLLSGFTDAQHLAAYEEFLAYKVRVPVRGAILLDERMERLVLVRGWKKGATWSFPRGKINKDERDLDCAMREVWEETGFDIAASGLLPENYQYDEENAGGEGGEGKIKYIDITMREQHIRLFVFRGVPLDTRFETQTRKEISKIQWYAIKDLPGFKKNNHKHASHQSEAETQQATKFYMVAPFLGPLKKWINLQRKKDIANAQKIARNSALSMEQVTGTEDDTEDQMVDHGVSVDRSREEEFKKFLSIGASPPAVPLDNNSAAAANPNAGDLLAMLQLGAGASNGGYAPHTPFDQINAFPPHQPETPQPQHLRDPSLGYHQQHAPPPPQFPFSPQRLQQEQQRNFPIPTPNIFGPSGFPQNPPPPGFQAGMPTMPPHVQQQPFPPRPNMPGPPQRFGPQPNFPFSNPGISQPQPQIQPQPPQAFPPFRGPPPPQLSNPALMAPQGPQGAIASGPSAPNASQLPPPKLNSHTMKLLDAFKAGPLRTNEPTPTPPPQSQGANQQRPTNTHQTALLDLFKRGSTSETPADMSSTAETPLEAPLSPALTDVTEKPPPRRPKAEERRATLNEITRTLPPSTKPAKATAQTPTSPFAAVDDSSPAPAAAAVEKRLFDPNDSSAKAGRGNIEGAAEAIPTRKVLSRPGSGRLEDRRSPGAVYGPRSPAMASPSQQNGLQQQQPAFTILARPGSSSAREVKSPPPPSSSSAVGGVAAVTPTSPVFKHEAETPKAAFAPQVLKRPQSGQGADTVGDAGKKEQLLALFGKGSPAVAAARPGSQQGSGVQQPASTKAANANANANALLDLFASNKVSSPSSVQSPISAAITSPLNPTPPPAPRLDPTTSSTGRSPVPSPQNPLQSQTQTQSQHQHLLLNLFNSNKSASTSSTPAPATTNTAAPKHSNSNSNSLFSPETPISPFTLGTPVAKIAGEGSGMGEVDEAKVKQKQFLMGYLDQVVRGEGSRGYGL